MSIERARMFFDPTGKPPRRKPDPAQQRAARTARMPADKHGTPAGYQYWGCRKPCCLEAASQRWANYPARGK